MKGREMKEPREDEMTPKLYEDIKDIWQARINYCGNIIEYQAREAKRLYSEIETLENKIAELEEIINPTLRH